MLLMLENLVSRNAPQNIKALCLKVRDNQYLCGQINKMKQS